MREKLIELLDMNCGYVNKMRAKDLADILVKNIYGLLGIKPFLKVYIISNKNEPFNFLTISGKFAYCPIIADGVYDVQLFNCEQEAQNLIETFDEPNNFEIKEILVFMNN